MPSGKIAAEYATGVAKNHACERNGTAYCTSRYFTFSAESQSVTATDATTANSRKNGRKTTCQLGTIPYQAIIAGEHDEADGASRRARRARGRAG